jgi:hypothetical protein
MVWAIIKTHYRDHEAIRENNQRIVDAKEKAIDSENHHQKLDRRRHHGTDKNIVDHREATIDQLPMNHQHQLKRCFSSMLIELMVIEMMMATNQKPHSKASAQPVHRVQVIRKMKFRMSFHSGDFMVAFE